MTPYCWVVLIVCINHNFFIHSPVAGHLSFFQFGVIMNKPAVSTSVHFSLWTYIFISLGKTPSWIVGPHDRYIFTFIRNNQSLFQNDCIILHLHLKQKILIVPQPYQHLVISIFNFSHFVGCAVVFHYGFYLHLPDKCWC